MKKLILFFLLFLFPSVVFSQPQPITSVLSVSDDDTVVNSPWRIGFSGATVTESGGRALITIEAGSGSGDITAVTAGAGLSGGGTTGAVTLATASSEADFILSGALTCGASTQGKAQIHTTPLQYCDNAATPALQYAAYGSSTGVATSATALAANGANCSASQAPLGVDTAGAVESCTDFEEELTNSAGLLAALSDETVTGLAVFDTSPTIATPIETGKIDRNNVAVDDDDCTSEQGLYWYDTTDSRFEWCNANSGTPSVLGGGGITNLTLPVQSAKLTGTFAVAGDASQGAAIDAGEGPWKLLFDATTDEGAVWQFIMPDNYASTPILTVHFSMASGESLEVQFEGSIMCYTSGTDTADVATASFAAVDEGTATTVSATAGEVYQQSITLTDDACAAGDMVWIQLSTDADDAVNDDATGDREVIGVEFGYTGS